ncbi:MAG: hypothetical protein FJW24_10990 [Acidimicrobiia bacterium]|nr:hypothetical protein [Acidimicrobiia bacterium]
MKLPAAICVLLLSAAPALAAPQCDADLARLESGARVFAVARYGKAIWTERHNGRSVAHLLHAWQGTENGAPRILTLRETASGSGPTWDSARDPKELKAKIAWRKLDGVELEDVIRVSGGPLEGEWKLACEGRPPIKVSFPRFADYPAKARPYTGRIARMKVPRGLGENLRLRVKESLGDDDRPSIAGRYIRLTWPCGTACAGTGLMDARTGRVIVAHHMSGWGEVDESFEPIQGRLDSRLVVLSGRREERGFVGRHFYVLENGRLRHLRSVEVERTFPQKLE